MYCSSCGKPITGDAKFCSGCGAMISPFVQEGMEKTSKIKKSRNLINDTPPLALEKKNMLAGNAVSQKRTVPVSVEKTQWSDNALLRTERAPNSETKSAPIQSKFQKRLIVFGAVAVALTVAIVLAVVLLDGALIPTGNSSYHYFGTLEEMVSEDHGIIGRIHREGLTVTCSDFVVEEAGGMDDSVTNTTHYASGLVEPDDRFMEIELLITRKSDGWNFYFERYNDAIDWALNPYYK